MIFILSDKKLAFQKNLFLKDYETSILSVSNNFRAWRGRKEEIYFPMGTKKRKNLLLIVSKNKIIHYKISDNNTNEHNFLEFIKAINSVLSKQKEKYVIIMDNLCSLRTKKLFSYYKKNKLNIIFNIIYLSNFNLQ